MGKFKGTQGKWKVRGEYRIDIITDDDKAYGIVDFGTEQDAFLADLSEEEWRANALLISKAPEMLEMLVECKNILDQHCGLDVTKIEQLIKESTEL